ncbi:MAG TPA: FAD-dependent oxidoreductase [Gaiellaceae bacterium]|nr:FAD-dependent oxidoreductase [Gaiellaceae bacterium]
MVTAEEIRRIAIFGTLGPDECERLSRAAADISLQPGEYAVSAGEERALFAVIDGCLQGFQEIDGIERVIAERGPGQVFGEVPITLGTVFPVSFRAKERSRVMRLEVHDFHAISSTAPDLGREVGRLAAERLGGLQGLAADPPPPRLIVVGHRRDGATAELGRFLDRNHITFRSLDGEDEGAVDAWGGPLPGEDDRPAIRLGDGRIALRPGLRRVAELLGLGTEPARSEYDTLVVGGGPAGMAAAVYGASEGLRTIVVERDAPGGQAGTSSRIENYLGFPAGVSGGELASRALHQARRLGAEILVTRTITRIDAERRELHLDGGDVLRARTVILACGVSWRRLEIEGFDRLRGKGIHYGAARSEAPRTHGLDVHIIGAGNSAGQAALFFATHAKSVTILCRSEGIENSMSRYLVDQIGSRSNIRVLSNVVVDAAHGSEALEAIDIRTIVGGETARVQSGGVFIFIGADAETDWLPPEIALDRHGYVLTGADVTAAGRWSLDRDPYLLETSVPGVFACGDVRFSPVKRVAAAVGEGSMAIAFVHQYLRDGEAPPPRA